MENFPSSYAGLRKRLEAVIKCEVPERGRFIWLEESTGISRNTWMTFWKRKTASPSGEMIQAIGRCFPKYAFWLATGLTDGHYGHTLPLQSKSFPEAHYGSWHKRFDDYFSHCMEMQMKVYGSEEPYLGNGYQDAVTTMFHLAWLRGKEIEMLKETETAEEMRKKVSLVETESKEREVTVSPKKEESWNRKPLDFDKFTKAKAKVDELSSSKEGNPQAASNAKVSEPQIEAQDKRVNRQRKKKKDDD